MEIRRTYAELDARKKNGELGVTVRYKNGISYFLLTAVI